MAYKQIDERFWKDQKVKRLSKDGYLFFLYLLTSPHTHFTGLSESMLDYVNIDTPLTEKESKAAFKELIDIGVIDYDKTNKLVWIKNMHKYQVKSEKQRRGAEIHLNALPKSELCRKLADGIGIPYRYPIDTLSVPEILAQIPYFANSETENTLSIQEEAKAKAKAKEEAKETIKEKTKKPDAVFEFPEELNTPDFLKLWQEWQEHLKEKKTKTTTSAFNKQLVKLASFGLKKALHTLSYCIEKNWQGIYEDPIYAEKERKQAEADAYCADGPSDETLAQWEREIQEAERNKCK